MGARNSRALPESVRAATLRAPGDRPELALERTGALRPGEVLVEVRAAAINPSDLAHLRGRYAHAAAFPAKLGFEGAGVVVASGGGLQANWMRGRRVSFFCPNGGSWASHAIAPVSGVFELSSNQSFDEGAMGLANPLTAVMFLDAVRQRGSRAVVLTAAASAIARMFVRLLSECDILPILVVRRSEQAAALSAENPKWPVFDQSAPGFEERLAAVAKEQKAQLCFDCVGGELLEIMIRVMPPCSSVYVYGALSAERTAVDAAALLFAGKTIYGFHLRNYIATLPFHRLLRAYFDFLRFRRRGLLASKVSRRFALRDLAAAIDFYKSNMSLGKVLLIPD